MLKTNEPNEGCFEKHRQMNVDLNCSDATKNEVASKNRWLYSITQASADALL